MQVIAFAVEKQRQESPFCHEENLSKGDPGAKGDVKEEVEVEVGLRQSRNLVVVLQVQVQVRTFHLSYRPSLVKANWKY